MAPDEYDVVHEALATGEGMRERPDTDAPVPASTGADAPPAVQGA